MKKEEFIQKIKEIRDGLAKEQDQLYISPPGRKPREKLKKVSSWYNQLSNQDREEIKWIIKDSLDASIFHFLCVLDHVSFLEDTEEKTKFELYAVKNGKRVLLNDSSQEDLHDLYNSLVLED